MGFFNNDLIEQLRSEIAFLRGDHARLLTELELQRQRLTSERDAAMVESTRLRLLGAPVPRSPLGTKQIPNPPIDAATPAKLKPLRWADVQDQWHAQQDKELEQQRKDAEQKKSQEN